MKAIKTIKNLFLTYFLILLTYNCSSFELTDKGKKVRHFTTNDTIAETIKKKCNSTGSVNSDEDGWEFRVDTLNRAGERGANVVLLEVPKKTTKSNTYNCPNLDVMVKEHEADMARLKEEEERIKREQAIKDKLDAERREKFRYTKPHFWLTCRAENKEMIKEEASDLAPKDYDVLNECNSNLKSKDLIAKNIYKGECSCKFMKMPKPKY